jgi:hypothetical protein
METRYDRLANYADYHKGDSVALLPNPHEGEIAQTRIIMIGKHNRSVKVAVQGPDFWPTPSTS